MADSHQLEQLLKGSDHWNTWRSGLPRSQLPPGVRSGALRKLIDLSGANLSGADLSGADLRDVDLSGADLHQADLTGANLRGADLIGANLRGANLRKANLARASLSQANLIDASLDYADLSDVWLWETQRSGWSIKNVTCRRAFWDRGGTVPTEYMEGEFERIFAGQPRVKVMYPGGISAVDLLALPLVVKRLQAERPDSVLQVRSVQSDPVGDSVTLTVEDRAGRSLEALNTIASVAMLFDTVGRAISLRFDGLDQLDDDERTVKSLSVRFKIELLENFSDPEVSSIRRQIEDAFRMALMGTSPLISDFSIRCGSTTLEFSLTLGGVNLLAFLHQYKAIRAGVILLANDIRHSIEWIVRSHRIPERSDSERPGTGTPLQQVKASSANRVVSPREAPPSTPVGFFSATGFDAKTEDPKKKRAPPRQVSRKRGSKPRRSG